MFRESGKRFVRAIPWPGPLGFGHCRRMAIVELRWAPVATRPVRRQPALASDVAVASSWRRSPATFVHGLA